MNCFLIPCHNLPAGARPRRGSRKSREKPDEKMQRSVQCETCNKWKTLPASVDPHDLPVEWHCHLRTWGKPGFEGKETGDKSEYFCKPPNNSLIKSWHAILKRQRENGFGVTVESPLDVPQENVDTGIPSVISQSTPYPSTPNPIFCPPPPFPTSMLFASKSQGKVLEGWFRLIHLLRLTKTGLQMCRANQSTNLIKVLMYLIKTYHGYHSQLPFIYTYRIYAVMLPATQALQKK